MVRPQSRRGGILAAYVVAVMLTLTSGCSNSTDQGLPASAAPAQTTGAAPADDPEATESDARSSDGTGSDKVDLTDSDTGLALDPVSGLPHFQGSVDIRLTAGTRVVGFRYCEPAPERGRFCSADKQATYLTYPESTADVVLTDVTMAQNEQHTDWTVTLTVDDPKAARRAGKFAVSRAGTLLFVGPEDSVVLAHQPVNRLEPSIRNGTIIVPGITKAEAWDLVESMEALA